jgi:peptide chain release factor 1
MFDRLELLLKKYEGLKEKLLTPISNVKEMTSLMKEISSMEETINTYLEYKEANSSIQNLLNIIETETDVEMINYAKEELIINRTKMEESVDKLRILLLPKDPNDEKNVIVSIKGAVGGDEANIFAGDLYRMYQKYADSKGWKVKILDANESNQGGYSNIDILITGDSVYSFLKYESGGHRVQRVPLTESLGRVHTSIATVYVAVEADDVDLNIDWNDIRVDTFCSSGPGGQSVNTTKSAVRLTYIPTGLSVASQVAKSQYENKDLAFALLKSRILDAIVSEKEEKEGIERKNSVGTGERSEKIRTYNYPQNRVSDHRISLTLNRLDVIMEGKLDLVILPIIDEFQKRKLADSNE